MLFSTPITISSFPHTSSTPSPPFAHQFGLCSHFYCFYFCSFFHFYSNSPHFFYYASIFCCFAFSQLSLLFRCSWDASGSKLLKQDYLSVCLRAALFSLWWLDTPPIKWGTWSLYFFVFQHIVDQGHRFPLHL